MAIANTYVFKSGATGSEANVAGELDGSMTMNGAPVEITNKASGGYIEYEPDFIAGKQISFSVTYTATDETEQNKIKSAAETGELLPGIIEGVGGETWQCDTWSFTGRSDAAATNTSVQMSLTINTSGAYVYTAPVA